MKVLTIIVNYFTIVGAVAVVVNTCVVVKNYLNARVQKPVEQLARLKLELRVIMSERKRVKVDSLPEFLPRKYQRGNYKDLLRPAIIELKSEGFLRENMVTTSSGEFVREFQILNPVHDFTSPGAGGNVWNDA